MVSQVYGPVQIQVNIWFYRWMPRQPHTPLSAVTLGESCGFLSPCILLFLRNQTTCHHVLPQMRTDRTMASPCMNLPSSTSQKATGCSAVFHPAPHQSLSYGLYVQRLKVAAVVSALSVDVLLSCLAFVLV